MTRILTLFPIALALGAPIFVPGTGACAEATQIRQCQTISKPGGYVLANNLTATGDCLVITTSFVTIDLAGFSITGVGATDTAGISAQSGATSITVRNGSISNFASGVNLSDATFSIVEGMRVSGNIFGILANGIIRGNVAEGNDFGGTGIGGSGVVTGNFLIRNHMGISATGVVSGNFASGNTTAGIFAGVGSTVIGNTSDDNTYGFIVQCPSNVIENTAINNGEVPNANLWLMGTGCNTVNNVAPPP